MPRSYKYYYKVGIKRETQPILADIASELGYYVNTPSKFYGEPSPADFLDALAAAYEANETAVLNCLRAAGVEGDGPPPLRD